MRAFVERALVRVLRAKGSRLARERQEPGDARDGGGGRFTTQGPAPASALQSRCTLLPHFVTISTLPASPAREGGEGKRDPPGMAHPAGRACLVPPGPWSHGLPTGGIGTLSETLLMGRAAGCGGGDRRYDSQPARIWPRENQRKDRLWRTFISLAKARRMEMRRCGICSAEKARASPR